MQAEANVEKQDRLFSRREAAEFLGLAPQTLAWWACRRRGELPFIKLGRLTKYRLSDLQAFIARAKTDLSATSSA
jgi:hypothetical protein